MQELAHKITKAYFWYDPYNGADFEEVEAAVLEQLKDIDPVAMKCWKSFLQWL